MKQLSLVLLFCLSFVCLDAQEDESYFIADTEEGQFLIFGKSWALASVLPCGDFINEIKVEKGFRYTIIHMYDEMYNQRGVLIFDKSGKRIDYSAVQNERSAFYDYFECCTYVRELNGKLYFWDLIEPFEDKNDYDCYYDSQTDASEYLIPRYYIFDPTDGTVKMVILKKPCTKLIKDGKLNCE
jgi:hypothetical protein